MLEYAELHARSNFSFLEGASHPETLVEAAFEGKLHAIALTDRDGLYGSVRFAKAARTLGLAAIVGAELSIEYDTQADTDHDVLPRLVVLACNAEGYGNLTRLISTAQMRHAKGEARLAIDAFDNKTRGLVALSAGPQGYAESALRDGDLRTAHKRYDVLRSLFPDGFYIELQHHLQEDDARLIARQLACAQTLQLPYVATNGVYYARKSDAKLGDIVACIRNGTSLMQAETLLRKNAEYYIKTAAQMQRIFATHPLAIANTLAIAERARFRLERITGEFPDFPVEDEYDCANTMLRAKVYAGANVRYGNPLGERVRKQIEHELALIAQLELSGYFLIVWDIVREAARLDVLAQGRGSAANSAVCFALGITAVDPVGMELLFERFMSADRREIPDIDIDFAHDRREYVLQYVYEKYGREHAAMAAEVVTYRTRSAIRDVGKAFGLSAAQVTLIAAEYDARESLGGALGVPDANAALPESLRKRRDLDSGTNMRRSRSETPAPQRARSLNELREQRKDTDAAAIRPPKPTAYYGFGPKDFGPDPDPHIASPVAGALGEMILHYCRLIDGFPRHMSIHSGGMVITKSPLINVAPIEHATMRDRTVLQWDKDDLQELGLIKIDLLGLGMLSLIRNAFALAKRRYPDREPYTLATIPSEDAPTYDMLCRADSIGVFQVESRAQQSMLPRLAPRTFYDLVMQVAIIRPGPIQGQMVHPFLRRRAGREAIVYADKRLEPILKRTLGVPLFQEQGMRMAIECAGFKPGEADELRRAMGNKRSRERMQQIYPRLVGGMIKHGIDPQAADQLFKMLEGFADYGFPESHAASFALLAYVSAYLKCHEHAVFTAAILNVQPMGFYSSEVLINDAKRHGVVIKPITVNESELWSFVDGEGALRLGYHLVRGLGESARSQIEAEVTHKPFRDLQDFVVRCAIGVEALETLASANVFSPWYDSRRAAMWALRGSFEQQSRGELGALMRTDERDVAFSCLTPVEETRLDLWSTGISPTVQPIAHMRAYLRSRGVTTAIDLPQLKNRSQCRVGGLVITRQRPGTAKGFVFLTLEDETGLVNIIVQPKIYETFRRIVRASTSLIVDGIVQCEDGCIDIIAQSFEAFAIGDLGTGIRSRNFK